MASDAKFMRLVGLTEAKRQMARLPDVVRKEAYPAIRRSVDAIVATGKHLVPVRTGGAVPGGMLREYLTGRTSKKFLIGLIGIKRGARIHLRGRMFAVAKSTRVTRLVRLKSGQVAKRSYTRFVSRQTRERLKARGGWVQQPTKYGHFAEFGSRRQRAYPFLRPAVRANQALFEANIRGIAPDVEQALAQQGYKG